MLPGKVLQQSGNAHATPAEPADDGVQFVPHILTDEHRLAVPDLRDGEVRFPVLLQRGPALPAARPSSHGVFRFRRGVLSSRLPGHLFRNGPGWNHRFRIRTGGFSRTGFHHESFPPPVVAGLGTMAMEIPEGYAGLVFARSGLASKRGLAPANKVGVVDSDYRGEIIVALHNHGDEPQRIEDGERIAQIVVTPFLNAAFVEADSLAETERGEGGFGSTGRK